MGRDIACEAGEETFALGVNESLEALSEVVFFAREGLEGVLVGEGEGCGHCAGAWIERRVMEEGRVRGFGWVAW